MSKPGAPLLSRRLLIVTGKGGVGKTSLAAALGVMAARRGIDTVVVEVGGERAIPDLLQEPGEAPEAGDGRQPVRISPHLYSLHLDPLEALTEYLELQIRVRPLVRLLVRNAGFHRLLEAAPGWRELITLGKLWHLESQRCGGEPQWDLLVVDAPATGHGLALLSVPEVVLETVRLGPLRRHTDWVQALIRDPERTLVLPVSLPEELPVAETRDVVARVRELGIAVGPVFANGVEPRPRLPELAPLFRALEQVRVAGLPPAAEMRAIADHCARRSALQQRFVHELERDGPSPVVPLPYLVDGVQTRADVERLADALEAALEGSEQAA